VQMEMCPQHTSHPGVSWVVGTHKNGPAANLTPWSTEIRLAPSNEDLIKLLLPHLFLGNFALLLHGTCAHSVPEQRHFPQVQDPWMTAVPQNSQIVHAKPKSFVHLDVPRAIFSLISSNGWLLAPSACDVITRSCHCHHLEVR